MKRLMLVLAMVVFLVSGCGEGFLSGPDHTCRDQIEDTMDALGFPDELDKYDTSDGYHSWSYWYWCLGINYSFTWHDSSGSCKWSTYEFEPHDWWCEE